MEGTRPCHTNVQYTSTNRFTAVLLEGFIFVDETVVVVVVAASAILLALAVIIAGMTGNLCNVADLCDGSFSGTAALLLLLLFQTLVGVAVV